MQDPAPRAADLDVDDPDFPEWFLTAIACGVSALGDMVRWLEGGEWRPSLEPLAWDNTMAALERVVLLGLTDQRVTGIPANEEDLQRLRRVHILGGEALSGHAPSPELLPFARQCSHVLRTGNHLPPV
jgi:hypothetical protein